MSFLADIISVASEQCCEGAPKEACRPLAAPLSDETVSELANWFKVLSDPTRIRILSTLSQGELCVCDLAGILGMTPSAISHQLRYLRAMRLVKNRKVGTTVYYTHDDAHTTGLLQMATDHVAHVIREEGG